VVHKCWGYSPAKVVYDVCQKVIHFARNFRSNFFFPNPCQLLGIYHVLWLTCLCFFFNTESYMCRRMSMCSELFFFIAQSELCRACVSEMRPFIMWCIRVEPLCPDNGNSQDLVKWNLSCPAMHIIWTTCNHDSKTLP